MQRGGWLLLLLLSFLACSSRGGAGNSAGNGPTADTSAGNGPTADNSAGNGPTADNSAGNGPTSDNQTPAPTDPGTSLGEKLTQTIGASGGTVVSADGRLTLTFPEGALDSDTEIGIEPITNTAPLGIGTAYRLTPDGAKFPTPITVTFSYTPDDIKGSSSDALYVGYQSSDGLWHTLGSPTVDTTNLTVSNPMVHFTDVSPLMGWQLTPADGKLAPLETVALKLRVCEPEAFTSQGDSPDDELSALTYRCDLEDSELPRLVNVKEWAVNGMPGGSHDVGYVMGLGRGATYEAPSLDPPDNPVAVSVAFTHRRMKTLAVSNFFIGQGGWSGTLSWTLTGDQTTYDAMNKETYSVNGTGTITVTEGPDGMPMVESAMTTYHYSYHHTYHNISDDNNCTRDVRSVETETLDGTSSDVSSAGVFIVDQGNMIGEVLVSLPQGQTSGDTVTDASETDTGTGANCSGSTAHTDVPAMGVLPYDALSFQAPYANGGLHGTTTLTVDGQPPHNYTIKYDLTLK